MSFTPPGFSADSRGGSPVVLVTGTSSGIGLALARELVQGDFRVVLTAHRRSVHKLEERGITESEKVIIRAMDVTSKRDRDAVFLEVERRWGGVDVLINNAGVAYRAVMEEISGVDEERQQDINYRGPMALCRRAIAHMRGQRWGRILNVSSVSGMMAMPTMGSYSASKWALEGASEALWYEMKPWDVRVTLIQIGFVHSQSFKNVRPPVARPHLEAERGPYREYYRNMGPFVEAKMNAAQATPEVIARRILSTLKRKSPPLRFPATKDARLFYFLRRMLPRRVYHLLMYMALPGRRGWVK